MARTFRIHSKRTRALVAGLIVGFALGGALGCGTPQERYKTLSRFFDGVPNPDDEQESQGQSGKREWKFKLKGSTHKPWAERECSACHPQRRKENEGNIIPEVSMTTSLAAWKQCHTCHSDAEKVGPKRVVVPKGAWLHGPAAAGECRACHLPHRSDHPFLLRTEKIEETCRGCHQTVGPRSGAMAQLDCAKCHDPHFSPAPGGFFLRRFGKQGCAECHVLQTEARPWVHGPVTTESCTVCHDAHGRPGSKRHVFRPIAQVCLKCHAEPDLSAVHRGKQSQGKECDSCHDPHAASAATDFFLRAKIRQAGVEGTAFRDPRKQAEPDAANPTGEKAVGQPDGQAKDSG